MAKNGNNMPYTLKDLCVPPLKVEAFCADCEVSLSFIEFYRIDIFYAKCLE